MTTEKRAIGINQRIPIAVLDNALTYILRGDLQLRAEINRDLSEHIEGQNRLGKAAQLVNRIVLSTDTAKQFARHFDLETYMHLSEGDKKALILALLGSAFPFVFDIATDLATILQAQPLVNAKYLQEKISAKYGSNRATFIGFYAVIPMFLELGIIKRPKNGLYEKSDKYPVYTPIIKELYIQTQLLATQSKSILLNQVSDSPWFFYFDFGVLDIERLRFLNYAESGYSGRGVLSR